MDILKIPYRVFLRSALSIEIALTGAGIKRKAQGYSEDLSETGMLVEVSEYIPRGSTVGVEFQLAGVDKPVKLNGEGVRAFMTPATSYIVIVDGEGKVAYTGIGPDQEVEEAILEVLGQ